MVFQKISTEKFILLVLSLFTALALWILHLMSSGMEGGMDSYNHYLIARYSWQHPSLLLDYWGKPIYNIIASPFAQFGVSGLVLLNIVSLLLTSLFVYQSAKNYGIKRAWLVYIACLCSPVFLDNTISALTEPLNALMLSACIYLFSKNKLKSALLLSGFLPFARSEGFVLISVFAFYLIFIEKKYILLLYLAAGSLVFNFLGWLIEGKMLWILSDNPYLKFQLSGDNICGSGSLIHYFRWGHVTFGLILSLLMIWGAFLLLRNYLKNSKTHASKQMLFIVLLAFSVYLLVHSLIWWLGMMGSCGYIRVMTVISPLAALIAIAGFNDLLDRIPEKWRIIIIFLFVSNLIYSPIKYYAYKYPLDISEEQKLFTKVHLWYQEAIEWQGRPMIYMYPYFSMIANIDPWNREQHEELYFSSLPYLKKGSLVIWDGHFGPNEAGIPLDYLMQSPDFKLIQTFKPETAFKTLNHYDFEIYVFEKVVN